MSLKKMHEEQKENRQQLLQPESSSTDLTQEMQVELIERQRKRIEQQDRGFEEMRAEYRKRMEAKEKQCIRAWEEVDKLRKAPPRIEIRERYIDKCNSCKLEEYRQAVHGARRYVRFLTVMLATGIVCEIIQSRIFLRDLVAFIKGAGLAVLALVAGPAVPADILLKRSDGSMDLEI